MKNVWIPGVRFGPFEFGASVIPFVESGKVVLGEFQTEDPTETEYKSTDGRFELTAEKSKIVSVSVFSDFFYKSKNLIGLSEDEAAHSVDSPAIYADGIIYDDNSVTYPLEWHDLGLILWVEEDRVIYATCYSPD